MFGWDQVRSLFGLVLLVALSWSMSTHRRRIDWRLVGSGLTLQLILALFVSSSWGQTAFGALNGGVQSILGYAETGATFVFGKLADGSAGVGATIAFAILPSIIFFSSLMAVLYHLGIMGAVIRGLAWSMQRTLKTSGAETLCAAGNIFVGQTEAPLLVRPFLPRMSRSELMVVMSSGFATVAGGVLIAYVRMLRDVFPDVAGHMLSASLMSAPAALVVAKIMVPETEGIQSEAKLELPRDVNVLDAAARGASEGLKLALNVGAMLIAFVGLMALVNGVLSGVGGWFGFPDLSLQWLLGWVLAPLAYMMGVPWAEAREIGSLMGLKTVLNELVAYESLASRGAELSDRAKLIAVYALCGFANFASIAIQLGGLGPLAPDRRRDLANLALRAMIAGNLAAFMTASMMGMLRS